MLSKYFYPHIGGVEKHVEEVSRELIKKGHRIIVLTLKHNSKLPEIETNRGVKIIRLPYSESKWIIWKNLWQKRSLIKSVDIIHCHDIFFWYLPFKFLFPRKPAYTTFHGWEGEFPIPKKNIFIRQLSEKLSLGNICVGDYIKKHYHTKPDYITYGGVDYTFKSYDRIYKKNSYVIFIGRLEKDMGMEEYLKALKTIKQKHGLKITFVGDGPYRSQAEKIGPVTGMVKTIKPYLKKPAYIFASSYLTILEVMIAKRPVFALYQNPLKKDYLQQFPGARYMRISGSADELIKQFDNALKNPKKIDRMIIKAHNFAKTQTWDRIADMYLKLWKKGR